MEKKIYLKTSDYFKNGLLWINCITDNNEDNTAQYFEIDKTDSNHEIVQQVNQKLGRAYLVTDNVTPNNTEDLFIVYENKNIKLFEFSDEQKKAIELQQTKAKKLQELAAYDSSAAVNSFTINGVEMWLSKEQRTSLTTLANACQKLGQATMQLQIKEGVFVELPTEQVLQILAMIELYAGSCYIVTQKHSVAISKLETVKEIDEYDFTQGYPEKLNF